MSRRRRWVIKLGSAQLAHPEGGLDGTRIARFSQEVAQLTDDGVEVVVVSSGAVVAGLRVLGRNERPKSLPELQASAAVGQAELIRQWEQGFDAAKRHCAQILLTHDDLANRQRYLNARSTLETLIGMQVIPVVNEDDTVANDELKVGDNDNLAALVSNLVAAELLIILTDQDGLFDADPRTNPNANLIDEADSHETALDSYAGSAASGRSVGGMRTKVEAARIAARSGTDTLIVNGADPGILAQIAAGAQIGTRLKATQAISSRKRWLASHSRANGTLHLDAGATKSLRSDGRSLLAVGVQRIEGEFTRGDLVDCVDADGHRIACGLVNYDADECRAIAGHSSDRIAELLGYCNEPEVIHRDNLVLTA